MALQPSHDDDLVLGWFHQMMMEDGFQESSKNSLTLADDPEYFQALWDSYLNYEILAEGDKLPVSQQLEMTLNKAMDSFRFSPKSTIVPSALTPLPVMRSSVQEIQYSEGIFDLHPASLPGVKLTLAIKARPQGIDLDLTSASTLPAWVGIKLLKDRELIEMQNFGGDGCTFYCQTPQGNWSLVLSDLSGKRKDSRIVNLKFKP